MTAVHFKFMYRTTMHRIEPTAHGDELLHEIKARVASIVIEPDYKLFWNNSSTNVLLETMEDLTAALDHATTTVKTSKKKTPFVLLAVKQQDEVKLAVGGLFKTVIARPSTGGLSSMTSFKRMEVPSWLLLQNFGNDCFLNAALQYLKRNRDLGVALDARRNAIDDEKDTENKENMDADAEIREKREKKERVLQMLQTLLQQSGRVSPREFREALPTVIKGLEEKFLSTQQDAYEILTKIFDDVIPEKIGKQFTIESARRRRCRDNANCKGCELVDTGVIHYQHISSMNQVVDLQSLLSSEWTEVKGENEPRHCSACCECCTAAAEGHVEDQCEDCKEDRRHYIEEQRFLFKGDSNYALIAFNILHTSERMDWALSADCKLDKMKMMGHKWRAVSIIKHLGSPIDNWSAGHYVCYTREDDGKWWKHDDDAQPEALEYGYRMKSGYQYPPGSTDMQGVLAILFEKKR